MHFGRAVELCVLRLSENEFEEYQRETIMESFVGVGHALCQAHNYADALAHYERAIDLWTLMFDDLGSNERSFVLRFLNEAASLRYRCGDTTARAHWDCVFALGVPVYFELCWRGREVLRRSLCRAGNSLRRAGCLSAALVYLERAVALAEPEFDSRWLDAQTRVLSALLNIGAIHKRVGDTNTAILHWEPAFALGAPRVR